MARITSTGASVRLSANAVARILEMQERVNANRREKMGFEEVLEWALLRQYNRTRGVKRHALSLKGVEFEISPLEERDGPRGTDDE